MNECCDIWSSKRGRKHLRASVQDVVVKDNLRHTFCTFAARHACTEVGELFNRVILVGRLVADPEVRYTPNGIPVASFRLAVDRPVRRGAEKQTDFIRVVTFRRLAEFAQSYLTKGRLVLVEGRLKVNSYTDRMGQRRTSVDVIAFTVQFMDRKPEGVSPAAPSTASGYPIPLESDFLPEQDVPVEDEILEELPPIDDEETEEFPF